MPLKDNTQAYGKWMMYLTWILALAMASYLFQGAIEKKFNPNKFLSTQKQRTVTLQQNVKGHYVATGMINDVPVVFLLDTGATDVVVSDSLARTLGLMAHGKTKVATANGIISADLTTIAKISLGGITANNIDALINPFMSDDTVLLGMSFLKHLTLIQKGSNLTLSTP
jgi:aspartyl protease family protein